jgi:hypothetical protein
MSSRRILSSDSLIPMRQHTIGRKKIEAEDENK